MSENNGKFIRGVFWTLILASFAWATAILLFTSSSLSAHSRDSDEKADSIKTEMITRDENMLKVLTEKLDVIIAQNTDSKAVFASYARQVDVNTQRITTLEHKLNGKPHTN